MLKGDTALDMRGRCSAGQKAGISATYRTSLKNWRWTRCCGRLRLPLSEGEAPYTFLVTLGSRQTQLYHGPILLLANMPCSALKTRKRVKVTQTHFTSTALLLRERTLFHGPPKMHSGIKMGKNISKLIVNILPVISNTSRGGMWLSW